MKYRLHPEAALEHERQVAYYEARAPGLGRRYHSAFQSAIKRVCERPQRFRVVLALAIRRGRLYGFPFSIVFRETHGEIQVLAIAHHRRRPRYWETRL